MANRSFDSVGKLVGSDTSCEKRAGDAPSGSQSPAPREQPPLVTPTFHEGGWHGWLAVLGG